MASPQQEMAFPLLNASYLGNTASVLGGLSEVICHVKVQYISNGLQDAAGSTNLTIQIEAMNAQNCLLYD